MTDPSEPTPETPGGQPVSAGAQAPSNTAPYVPGSWPSDAGPAASTSATASYGPGPAALAADRPELAVGAAFAGGFLFAMVLKRLAR